MTNLASFADPLFALIATYLIHSTIFLAGCWILLRFTRSASHTLEDRAWKMAAVAGFVTTVAQTVLGNASILNVQLAGSDPIVAEHYQQRPGNPLTVSSKQSQPSSKWSVRTFVQPMPKTHSVRSESSIRGSAIASTVAPSTRSMSYGSASNLALSIQPSFPGKSTFVATAIVWVVFGLVCITVQTIVMRFRVQRMPLVASGRTRRLLDGLLKGNRIDHRVDLRSSRRQMDPIALGCRRWTIIEPENLGESLSDDEIKAVLTHELGHFVRRDVIWLWIGRVLGACFGFQPLNFVARRRWQRASEYLCDQWAVQHGTRRLDLAKCLTTLATLRIGDREPRLALAATGTKATLVGRVERLVSREELIDSWQTKPKTWLSWMVALSIAGLMVLAAPVVRAADARADDSPSSLQSGPNAKRVPLVLERIDLDTTLQDFEAWIRLDLEIADLMAEIGQATRLADQSADSKEMAAQVQKIRRAVASLDQHRNEISNHFMREN